MKSRFGALIMGAGALSCALACAAPLLGLGALGLMVDLEWVGIALFGLGVVVALIGLARRRSKGCGDGAGGTDVC